MGIGPLLLTRVGGLVAAAFIFSILIGVLVFVPFMVIGAWRRRRDALFGPFLGYAVLLFAFSAIVSAVHVPGGTFIHSAVALAPQGYVLALEGIVAGGGLARRATQGLGRDVGRARVRRRGGRLRGARRRRRRERGAPELGRQAPGHAGRGDRARRRGRARDRPGHVDRRLRVPLLDRPPGRGAGQRPAGHGGAGRARVRDPLARPRAQGQRRGGARDPGRPPAAVAGSGRRSSRATTSRCTRSASRPATPAVRPRSRARAGEPARGVDHGARGVRGRDRGPRRGGLDHLLPEARGHGLLRRRRAQPASRAAASCRTRCGATARRRWCSRGPRSRCGCRSRRCSPPSRWP